MIGLGNGEGEWKWIVGMFMVLSIKYETILFFFS